jgi:hypothetical protein
LAAVIAEGGERFHSLPGADTCAQLTHIGISNEAKVGASEIKVKLAFSTTGLSRRRQEASRDSDTPAFAVPL